MTDQPDAVIHNTGDPDAARIVVDIRTGGGSGMNTTTGAAQRVVYVDIRSHPMGTPDNVDTRSYAFTPEQAEWIGARMIERARS